MPKNDVDVALPQSHSLIAIALDSNVHNFARVYGCDFGTERCTNVDPFVDSSLFGPAIHDGRSCAMTHL
jgi:hypothetical protein